MPPKGQPIETYFYKPGNSFVNQTDDERKMVFKKIEIEVQKLHKPCNISLAEKSGDFRIRGPKGACDLAKKEFDKEHQRLEQKATSELQQRKAEELKRDRKQQKIEKAKKKKEEQKNQKKIEKKKPASSETTPNSPRSPSWPRSPSSTISPRSNSPNEQHLTPEAAARAREVLDDWAQDKENQEAEEIPDYVIKQEPEDWVAVSKVVYGWMNDPKNLEGDEKAKRLMALIPKSVPSQGVDPPNELLEAKWTGEDKWHSSAQIVLILRLVKHYATKRDDDECKWSPSSPAQDCTCETKPWTPIALHRATRPFSAGKDGSKFLSSLSFLGDGIRLKLHVSPDSPPEWDNFISAIIRYFDNSQLKNGKSWWKTRGHLSFVNEIVTTTRGTSVESVTNAMRRVLQDGVNSKEFEKMVESPDSVAGPPMATAGLERVKQENPAPTAGGASPTAAPPPDEGDDGRETPPENKAMLQRRWLAMSDVAWELLLQDRLWYFSLAVDNDDANTDLRFDHPIRTMPELQSFRDRCATEAGRRILLAHDMESSYVNDQKDPKCPCPANMYLAFGPRSLPESLNPKELLNWISRESTQNEINTKLLKLLLLPGSEALFEVVTRLAAKSMLPAKCQRLMNTLVSHCYQPGVEELPNKVTAPILKTVLDCGEFEPSHIVGAQREGSVGDRIIRAIFMHGQEQKPHSERTMVDKLPVREITYHRKPRTILRQVEGGPCFLIALCNILSLRKVLDLESLVVENDSGHWIELEPLLEGLAAAIKKATPKKAEAPKPKKAGSKKAKKTPALPKKDEEHSERKREHLIEEAVERLRTLTNGVYLDVKFSAVNAFSEVDKAMEVLDFLEEQYVKTVHGWIIDPKQRELLAEVNDDGYGAMAEKVASGKAPLFDDWWNTTKSQLSEHGVKRLHKYLPQNGDIAMLFRYNRYSVLVKENNTLWTLITDSEMSGPTAVWKSLDVMEEHSRVVCASFKDPAPGAPQQDTYTVVASDTTANSRISKTNPQLLTKLVGFRSAFRSYDDLMDTNKQTKVFIAEKKEALKLTLQVGQLRSTVFKNDEERKQAEVEHTQELTAQRDLFEDQLKSMQQMNDEDRAHLVLERNMEARKVDTQAACTWFADVTKKIYDDLKNVAYTHVSSRVNLGLNRCFLCPGVCAHGVQQHPKTDDASPQWMYAGDPAGTPREIDDYNQVLSFYQRGRHKMDPHWKVHPNLWEWIKLFRHMAHHSEGINHHSNWVTLCEYFKDWYPAAFKAIVDKLKEVRAKRLIHHVLYATLDDTRQSYNLKLKAQMDESVITPGALAAETAKFVNLEWKVLWESLDNLKRPPGNQPQYPPRPADQQY